MIRKFQALVLAVALTGCTTTSMEEKEPAFTFHSVRNQEAIADCLLNRLSSDQRYGRVDKRPNETVVSFDTIIGVALVFTIKDEPTGTVTEMRRFYRATPGKTNAANCF